MYDRKRLGSGLDAHDAELLAQTVRLSALFESRAHRAAVLRE